MVSNMDMKSTRNQLPYKDFVDYSKNKLYLVHSDICGPFNVESISGARYFATLIDDYTKYTKTVKPYQIWKPGMTKVIVYEALLNVFEINGETSKDAAEESTNGE